MKVENEFIDQSKDIHIEWGGGTWNSTDRSIRNRKVNKTGRYNQAASSQIPWNDFLVMIEESIKRNKFSNIELAKILNTISDNIAAMP